MRNDQVIFNFCSVLSHHLNNHNTTTTIRYTAIWRSNWWYRCQLHFRLPAVNFNSAERKFGTACAAIFWEYYFDFGSLFHEEAIFRTDISRKASVLTKLNRQKVDMKYKNIKSISSQRFWTVANFKLFIAVRSWHHVLAHSIGARRFGVTIFLGTVQLNCQLTLRKQKSGLFS